MTNPNLVVLHTWGAIYPIRNKRVKCLGALINILPLFISHVFTKTLMIFFSNNKYKLFLINWYTLILSAIYYYFVNDLSNYV